MWSAFRRSEVDGLLGRASVQAGNEEGRGMFRLTERCPSDPSSCQTSMVLFAAPASHVAARLWHRKVALEPKCRAATLLPAVEPQGGSGSCDEGPSPVGGFRVLSRFWVRHQPPVTGGKKATSSPGRIAASVSAYSWLTAHRTTPGKPRPRRSGGAARRAKPSGRPRWRSRPAARSPPLPVRCAASARQNSGLAWCSVFLSSSTLGLADLGRDRRCRPGLGQHVAHPRLEIVVAGDERKGCRRPQARARRWRGPAARRARHRQRSARRSPPAGPPSSISRGGLPAARR